MGGKLKLLIIAGIIAIIGFLIYIFFFKKSEQAVSVSSAKYSGTNFVRGGGKGAGNTYKNETKNYYGSGSNFNDSNQVGYNLSNNENVNSRKYLQNRNGRVSYASSFMNINEQEYNSYIRRSGDTLGFGTPDPELEKSIPPLDVPGFSARSYAPRAQSKLTPKVCVAIINEIYNGREQIKQMDADIAKYFILDRLRYIPNFGGLSQSTQDRYVNIIFNTIQNNQTIDAEELCEEIAGEEGNAIYKKCLIVLERIIINNIRDPQQIESMLFEGIPEFKYLTAEERKMVVEMIVDGMNKGDLSKEKICSIITSLIIDKIKEMLIYQKCIMVMNELSAMPQPLSAKVIEEKLNDIPGFSSLSKSQIAGVVKNIMNDPRTDGKLDAERHCLDIVGLILALIEGTDIYQACIKIMDEIIKDNITDPAEIAKKVREIPGFNVLSSNLQNKVIQSVLDAVNDGNLEEEKFELCRNITALILDELNKNNIFKQCRVILQGIVDGGMLSDEKKVRAELAKIPNFSVLPPATVDEIVKDVMSIDLNGDINLQIINICTKITSLIIDNLKGSEIFKMCIKMMDEIIAEGLVTDAEVRAKLSNIPGFGLLSKKMQDEFVSMTLSAILDGTLPERKEEICLIITSAIIDILDKNQLYQQCIKIVTAIFTDGKNKDREYVISQLKRLPKFTSFSIDVQNKYVDEIIAIEEPNIQGQIQVFCAKYVTDVETLGNIVQCVKKLASIVIYENREMMRADVRNHMMSVPSFVKATEAKQEKLIDKVMDLTANQTTQSEQALYSNVEQIGGEAFLLPRDKLQTHAEVLKILNKINGFSKINVTLQNQLAIDLTIAARECGSQNPKDCDEKSAPVFRNISNEIKKVSPLTFQVQISDFTKICNELETPDKPTKPDPNKPTKPTEPTKPDRPVKPPVVGPGGITIEPGSGTGNENNNEIDTNDNFIIMERESYGKCAILNRNIFEAYQEYLKEIKNNPSIIEEYKITALNDKQPDGEYYIPQQYMRAVEQGLIDEFEEILSNEGGENRENSIARVLYNKFNNQQLSTIQKLTVQTKSMLISRVFTDMKFLNRVSTHSPDLSQAYIVETGKCINPRKDSYDWTIIAERMQFFIDGKEEAFFNFTENANPKLINQKVEDSANYKMAIDKITEILVTSKGNPRNDIVLLRLNEISRFPEVNDSVRYQAVSGTINLAKRCTAYNNCKKESDEIAFLIGYHTITLPDAREKTPQELANVAKCFDYTPGSQDLSHPQASSLFASLPLDMRNIVADNIWILMMNFQYSAKNKRRDIINKIWLTTKKEYTLAQDAGRKPIPVSVPVCEQAMDEVWGNYNEDHLTNVIKGPLDELIAELDSLMTLFDGDEAMRDFTNPPSKKCKCYMQKIYQNLSSNNSKLIDDYPACRGDSTKNSAYVKMMASKYITSKEAAIDAIAQSGGEVRGKYLCSMIFKNVINIIDDQAEAEKFASLNASDNKHILNQICVQQLRDIYSTIGIFKTEYFESEEESIYNNASSCDGFKDD